ncbi:hypothetical protein V8D89_002173 [Ganoderma adspersum]
MFSFRGLRNKSSEHERFGVQIGTTKTVLGCVVLLGLDHLSLRAIEAFTSVSPNNSLAVLTKLRSVVLSDGDKGGTEGPADGVKEHVSLHVHYACLHWVSHLGEAKKTARLTMALDKFATPQTMGKWVETLGHLGWLDVAEVALDSASKWEEPNNPMRGCLDKARQLVANHYEKIEKSPGAVYSFEIREDSGAHHNPAAEYRIPRLADYGYGYGCEKGFSPFHENPFSVAESGISGGLRSRGSDSAPPAVPQRFRGGVPPVAKAALLFSHFSRYYHDPSVQMQKRQCDSHNDLSPIPSADNYEKL